MFMSGGMQSVKVILRNPLNRNDTIDYDIEPHDHELSHDWIIALKNLLQQNKLLEKNFCFMGFPKTARNLTYLCKELNYSIDIINNFFPDYSIEETFHENNIIVDGKIELGPNHELLNKLHNHFEILQGTVWDLSEYYRRADYETKYAIRQLNNLCHELENLILSQRKALHLPFWVRPSQITTFLNANRYDLKDSHRQLFLQNGYDRVLGGVYMHWTQIGKTLFEVFRDENAPELTDTICEAITELKYYSGEFDVEWGNDVVYNGPHPWHTEEQNNFNSWLIKNGKDLNDTNLSLGYLPIGQVALEKSFGTTHYQDIWDILSSHLDIYKIEVDGISATYDYNWSDENYKQNQINIMKAGYDFSSRG
jgi:hypothetical protein